MPHPPPRAPPCAPPPAPAPLPVGLAGAIAHLRRCAGGALQISKDEAAALKEPLLQAFLSRPHPRDSDPHTLFEKQEHYKV